MLPSLYGRYAFIILSDLIDKKFSIGKKTLSNLQLSTLRALKERIEDLNNSDADESHIDNVSLSN